MNLKALQADVLRISDIYAREHAIDRDRDWALLKLQEELGELTAEHLRMSGRARGPVDPEAAFDPSTILRLRLRMVPLPRLRPGRKRTVRPPPAP